MAEVLPRFKLRDSGGRFQSEKDWFRVEITGPLFDGTGQRALNEARRVMSLKVATAAQRHIQTIGKRAFRYEFKPATHYYENNITVDRIADGALVHANAVVYGAWIEGTSSRNQTSRFKGYHLFRKAAQETQRRLGQILSPEEQRLVAKLGGTGVRTGPVL